MVSNLHKIQDLLIFYRGWGLFWILGVSGWKSKGISKPALMNPVRNCVSQEIPDIFSSWISESLIGFSPPFWVLPKEEWAGVWIFGRVWFICRAGRQPRLGWALSMVPPFPNLRRRRGEATKQSWSQRGLVAGFGVSVGFFSIIVLE